MISFLPVRRSMSILLGSHQMPPPKFCINNLRQLSLQDKAKNSEGKPPPRYSIDHEQWPIMHNSDMLHLSALPEHFKFTGPASGTCDTIHDVFYFITILSMLSFYIELTFLICSVYVTITLWVCVYLYSCKCYCYMLFYIMYWVTDIFYCTFVLLSQQWLNKDTQSIMTIPPQWTRVVCGPCLWSTSGTTNLRLSGPREHARSHTSFCQLTAKKPSVCLFANNCQSVWLSWRTNTVLRLRNLRLFKNAQLPLCTCYWWWTLSALPAAPGAHKKIFDAQGYD